MQTVYMKETVNGYEKGRLVEMEYVDALQIQGQGKGILVEAGQDIQRSIASKVDKYREDYRAMTRSDDPVYKVEGAIDYYTKQMQEKLEKEIAELTEQWKLTYAGMRKAADEDAAKQRRYLTEAEKESAKQHATKAAQALKYGNDPSVLEELVRLAPQMPNGQKLALLDELERIEIAANGKHDGLLKRLYSELSSVIEEDMLAVKIVDLLADRSVDFSFRTLKITHPTYKHLKINTYNNQGVGTHRSMGAVV
ncbi:hypothetical protein [Paenibacillus sp. Y412MC10]|uniref:hypothetical protein n=1 Tax=Geobacillus sp. (strain Y412MC10) TaxID=481743 RepID=UPI0016423E42|nr:hypothetical protein [Paenibacillus sp. Y412MC10]